MPVLAAIAFVLFVFLLPAVVLLPSLPAEKAWLPHVWFALLAPFSSVLWFIVLHRLITQRRSRYLDQVLVFIATAILILLMIRLGGIR